MFKKVKDYFYLLPNNKRVHLLQKIILPYYIENNIDIGGEYEFLLNLNSSELHNYFNVNNINDCLNVFLDKLSSEELDLMYLYDKKFKDKLDKVFTLTQDKILSYIIYNGVESENYFYYTLAKDLMYLGYINEESVLSNGNINILPNIKTFYELSIYSDLYKVFFLTVNTWVREYNELRKYYDNNIEQVFLDKIRIYHGENKKYHKIYLGNFKRLYMFQWLLKYIDIFDTNNNREIYLTQLGEYLFKNMEQMVGKENVYLKDVSYVGDNSLFVEWEYLINFSGSFVSIKFETSKLIYEYYLNLPDKSNFNPLDYGDIIHKNIGENIINIDSNIDTLFPNKLIDLPNRQATYKSFCDSNDIYDMFYEYICKKTKK